MLTQVQKIHCIGIGGIGMSAVAEFFRAQGKEVTGYDDALTPTPLPEGEGRVREDADLVIYSDAVPEDHSQRVEARRRGIPELSYAQALGEISHGYRTIVVTGTHGKSTTTAMLGLMLEAAVFDPFVIVGSKVPGWEYGNLRLPSSTSYPLHTTYFIVEGDDYRDHFLELQPYAVVVTNIEYDHPDYFRDLEHTVESFQKLCEKVPEDGFVITNADDAGCVKLSTQKQHSNILKNVRMLLYGRGSEIFGKLNLQVPGEFNRYNATAAATCALELGVPRDVVERVAHEFRGIWRRFEIVGTFRNPSQPPSPRFAGEAGLTLRGGESVNVPPLKVRGGRGSYESRDNILIISDYGHHPTAIRETMKAAREFYSSRRLVLVYQPHQHSRTKYLFQDFVKVLKDAADLVIVSEIYAVQGRMEEQDVSSQMIVDKIRNPSLSDKGAHHSVTRSEIRNVIYGGNLEQTKQMVLEHVKPNDVIIFMGAGDIDQTARELCMKN